LCCYSDAIIIFMLTLKTLCGRDRAFPL